MTWRLSSFDSLPRLNIQGEAQSSSAASTLSEGIWNLVHRRIMPFGLANLLRCATSGADEVPDRKDEQHSTFRDLSSASAEAECRKDRLINITGAAADALRLLLLALRRIRVEYRQKRWVSGQRQSVHLWIVGTLRLQPPSPSDLSIRLPSGWPPHAVEVKETRWSVPEECIAISRFQLFSFPGRTTLGCARSLSSLC